MFNRLFGIGRAPKYESPEPDEPDATPLATVTGSLYVSSSKEDASHHQVCMYYSCTTKIRRTASPHHYELLISRDQDSEDDPLYPSDVVFPIDTAAAFDCSKAQCGWTDRGEKRYNLDMDDEPTGEQFREALARALFESVHQKEPAPEDKQAMLSLIEQEKVVEKPSDLLVTAGELVRVRGELYRYNVETEKFETVAEDVVVTLNSAIVKADNSRSYMMMVVSDEGERIIECEVGNDMNAHFYTHTLSVVWVLNLKESEPKEEMDPESQLCLSVKMATAEDYVRFRNQYSVCLFEVNHQATMDDLKLKDDDRDYVARTEWDDVEPMEIDEGDVEEDDRTIREDLPENRAQVDDLNDGMANSQLAVSANTDRTFVVRGNKMGVFQTSDDGAKFTTSIHFKDPSRQSEGFAPASILLHEQDRAMLLLDPRDETKMMRMDLERGEIVDTWSGPVTKNTPVSAIHRVAKYANLTDTKEFVGLNKNALLRMDPRTSEFIVQSKKYAASTRAKLDCVATTGSGHLAVASENGDIRLYDTIGKNAKTHLPGLGDKIIGIDVSEDGNYILATTAKYLLVINTVVQGQNPYSGFRKSMGKHKPTPRKLVIKAEDVVKYRMGEINFTPAHFNTGNSLERSIVTSSGPFLVTWSFRSVKLGRLDNYKVARYQDNVVADDFAYNNDGKIVVTLPNDVSVATRR